MFTDVSALLRSNAYVISLPFDYFIDTDTFNKTDPF